MDPIRYHLPDAVEVRLVVFDALGRSVAELVNGRNFPGQHEVVWDETGLASGPYLYRLEAGDFSKTEAAYLAK